jgi:hypothetical protein
MCFSLISSKSLKPFTFPQDTACQQWRNLPVPELLFMWGDSCLKGGLCCCGSCTGQDTARAGLWGFLTHWTTGTCAHFLNRTGKGKNIRGWIYGFEAQKSQIGNWLRFFPQMTSAPDWLPLFHELHHWRPIWARWGSPLWPFRLGHVLGEAVMLNLCIFSLELVSLFPQISCEVTYQML